MPDIPAKLVETGGRFPAEWNKLVGWDEALASGNWIVIVGEGVTTETSLGGMTVTLPPINRVRAGKLKEPMSRAGVAEVDVFDVNDTGGLGNATGEVVDVVDSGMIPTTDEPLPIGTQVHFSPTNDRIELLMAYDCEAVA